jgi:Pectate lyase superfamily protein
MTVSSSLSTQTFDCNGSTTVFTCPFRVLDAAELVGYLVTVATNVSVQLVNGTDFAVTGVGATNAIATTATVYSSAYRVNFRRRTQRLQATDYRDNDPFPAESHEAALDRLTHIAQENDTDISRALLAPEPETGITLPAAVDRADRLLGFDSDGAPVAVAPASGSASALATDLTSTAVATKGAGQVGYNAALAYAAGTVGAALKRTISVFDYMTGAQIADVQAGTAVVDVTSAIQAAIDAAYAFSLGTTVLPYDTIRQGGATVYLPSGKYKTTATLQNKEGVKLQGAGQWSTLIVSDYDGTILRNQTPVAYDAFGMGIADLSIIGDRTKTNQIGIALLRDWLGNYTNVSVINCGSHAWRLYQCIQTRLTNCEGLKAVGRGLFISDGIGSWAVPTATNLPSNNIIVYDGHFYGCDGAGIYLGRVGTGIGVMGCQFFGGSSEYNYTSSAAGTGYNVEIQDCNAAVPNTFTNLWCEDTNALAHVYINATDAQEATVFINFRHFGNGSANYPQKAAIVNKGRLVINGATGSGAQYRTYLGSNAPFQLTKATGTIHAINVTGSALAVTAPQIVDETGASTGLEGNIRVNTHGQHWGPVSFTTDSGQVGPSFYQSGQTFPYADFSTNNKALMMGAGAAAPVVALINNYIGVSADRGDASVTLVAGVNEKTQRFATALTANRTVTLSTTGAAKGHKFCIVRAGLGAFTMDVGGLKTIPSATAAWVDVEHDGTAWRLTGYGTL